MSVGSHDAVSIARGLNLLTIAASAAALWLLGLDDPNIGFPVAIALVGVLGLMGNPDSNDRTILALARGSITAGGIVQGGFIKAMFAVALVYAGGYLWIVDSFSAGLPRLLLGIGLSLSSLGNALIARSIDRKLSE